MPDALSDLPPPFVVPPAFAAELARLNERQREAVTHADGPLLVVAGPGTGKTQLLAARVAWLLLQPDVRPQEILCLTYTDAAAQNLRQRLLRFVGPDAHRVAIYTFHSLGKLIIDENAALLGHHDLEAASELETEELLRDLLDQLPAGHPLRRDTGSAYYDLPHLQRLFQTIKREGWSLPQLLHELEAYRLGLPDDEQYLYKKAVPRQGVRAGDVKQAQLAAEEQHITRAVAAAGLLPAYQQALAARGRYDYDDMLGWAIELLRTHEHLRLGYQERWQHLLADEYQDTNGVQSQLLHLLADYWEHPDLVVVGDDDQSIYRFQGASVANVLEFRERYPGARVVVLEENYRSSAAVLAAAGGLIGRNRERLVHRLPGLSKQLHARHPAFAASAVQPVLRRYATPLHEAAALAAELADLHRRGAWPAGGAAVLARQYSQHELLATLLQAAGVPFRRVRTVNVLRDEALARSLRQLLDYLAATQQPRPEAAEEQLFAALHLPGLHLPPTDLVRLATGYQRQRQATRATGHAVLPWRVWAAGVAADPASATALGLDEAGRLALARALALLDSWQLAAATLPVPALLEVVVLQTLLPTLLVAHAQPTHLLAVARTLLQFGRAEARRHPRLNLTELLRTWDTLAATGKGLPLEYADGTATAPLDLLTTHSAKGLEWERVWVLGCQQNAWLGRRGDRGFRLPPVLAPAPGEEADCEEARRLFFVALTRAQEHLTLSWAEADEAGKPLAECQFVTELQQDGWPVATPAVADEVLTAARHALLTPPPAPAPVPDPALLDAVLADFALSATTLNAYLQCPIACYYEHLLRVPAPRATPLLVGSVVHATLEEHFRQAHQHPQQAFGSAEELAADFARRLARHRHELTPAEFDRAQQAGQRELRAWWTQAAPDCSPLAVVEHHVKRALLPDGPTLTGKIDRLDPLPGGHYQVVDYKTGNPARAADKLRPAPAGSAALSLADWHADERLRGGDYWRQGIFYHLLLTHEAGAPFPPAAVRFDFLRPEEKPGRAPAYRRDAVVPTPEALATVHQQLAAVDAAIRRHDFTHGCGTCAWCGLCPAAA